MIVLRLLLRVFYIFPIKSDSVIISSYAGRKFACNPKYIVLHLLKRKDLKIYFVLNKDVNTNLPDNVIRINYFSLKHIYLLMTCKYIIVNSHERTKYFPYRNNQIYLYTSHGAYMFKKGNWRFKSDYYAKKIKDIENKEITYKLFNNSLDAKKVLELENLSKRKYLNFGYPRNDLLFSANLPLIEKIKKQLRIDLDKKIILYAPTYRAKKYNESHKGINEYGFELLDVKGIIESFNNKFGNGHVLLYRAHHDMLSRGFSEDCINVSNYPDIQELLIIADYLITDYSSLMLDFSLLMRPGFLYTPDLEEYQSNIPDWINISNWPFDYACSNEQFLKIVNKYDDEKSIEKIRKFLDIIQISDDGNATDRLCDFLLGIKNTSL